MSLKQRFAESFARSKTMSGPEKKANEILGKIIFKKTKVPIVIMLIVLFGGIYLHINGCVTFGINIVIAVISFFVIRKQSEKYQNFTP